MSLWITIDGGPSTKERAAGPATSQVDRCRDGTMARQATTILPPSSLTNLPSGEVSPVHTGDLKVSPPHHFLHQNAAPHRPRLYRRILQLYYTARPIPTPNFTAPSKLPHPTTSSLPVACGGQTSIFFQHYAHLGSLRNGGRGIRA